MRYTGEARFLFEGDKEKAMRLIPHARTLLGVLLNDAGFNDLQVATRRYRFDGGVTIGVSKLFGLMEIAIYVPVAEPVVAVAAEEGFELVHVLNRGEFIIGDNYYLIEYDSDGAFEGLTPLSASEWHKYQEASVAQGHFPSSSDNSHEFVLYDRVKGVVTRGDKVVYQADEGDHIIDACLIEGDIKVAVQKHTGTGIIISVGRIAKNRNIDTLFSYPESAVRHLNAFGDDGVFNLFISHDTLNGINGVVYKDSEIIFEGSRSNVVSGLERTKQSVYLAGMDRNGNIEVGYADSYFRDAEFSGMDGEWNQNTQVLEYIGLSSALLHDRSGLTYRELSVNADSYYVARIDLGSQLLSRMHGQKELGPYQDPYEVLSDNVFIADGSEISRSDGSEISRSETAQDTIGNTIGIGVFDVMNIRSFGNMYHPFDYYGGYFMTDFNTGAVLYKPKNGDVVETGGSLEFNNASPTVLGLLLKRQN